MSIILNTTLETLSLQDRYTLSQALQIPDCAYGDWVSLAEQKLLLMRELEKKPTDESSAFWIERARIAGIESQGAIPSLSQRLQNWRAECSARLRQSDIGRRLLDSDWQVTLF